jgi:hypothetical protein
MAFFRGEASELKRMLAMIWKAAFRSWSRTSETLVPTARKVLPAVSF